MLTILVQNSWRINLQQRSNTSTHEKYFAVVTPLQSQHLKIIRGAPREGGGKRRCGPNQFLSGKYWTLSENCHERQNSIISGFTILDPPQNIVLLSQVSPTQMTYW